MIYVLSIGIMTVHLLTLFLAETVCFMGEIHTYIYIYDCLLKGILCGWSHPNDWLDPMFCWFEISFIR